MSTVKLAADTINGVYRVSSIPPEAALYLDEMYDALANVKEGETIYGVVSDDVAKRIESEYGISE